MKSSFDIEVGGAGDIWGYLLYRALPIALAGILMLWLSGGGSIVPNILVQLFYIFTHLNVLMASKGEDTIISLVVLIIQAIILAVVWVFYIRIVIRTIVDLREIVSQVEHSQAMALAALSNEQIAVQKLEEQARRAQTSQHMAAAPAWRAPSAPANPPARGQQVYEAQDLNPFNADEEGSFLLDQPSAPRPAVTRRPTVQQTPPSPAPERPAAQQPLPQARPLRQAVDPYAASEESLFSGLPADSFAVEKPKAGEAGQGTPIPPATPNEFIFGNPFEGQLPDVFTEDEDLKRTLGDLPFPPQQ